MPNVCGRCGLERYPIFFLSTVMGRHTRRLEDAECVCEHCLTPAERFRLIELPEINRRAAAQKTEITSHEYEWALEYASLFHCPWRRSPLDCGDFGCEKLDECILFLEARAIMLKAAEGKLRVIEVKVKNVEQAGWEVQL